MTLVIFLTLIGLCTGIAGGLFGIGGGTIIVPMLIYLLGFEHLQAQGTSLAAMLLPVGLFGAIKYHREGYSNFKCSLLIGLGLLVGAWPGARLALFLPQDWLRFLYALFLIYVAWRFIEPIEWIRSAFHLDLKKKKDESALLKEGEPIDNWYWMLLIGFLGGISSGLFGVGGGAIIIPFLTFVFRFDHRMARVISLGALLPPVGFFGMVPYWQKGYIRFSVATPLALGILIGAYFGALIGVNIPKQLVKRLFGFLLLGMVANYLYMTIPVIF